MATSKPLKATTKPSTSIAVKKPTNIVAIQEALRNQVAALAGRVAPASGDNIQLKEKQFVLPDGTKCDTLDIVIVDFVSTHNYYEGKYDAKNIVPPNCFAIGINPLQMIPSSNSPDKQADNCQTCPLNQFGSDGDGKACKNGRRLAVLPPDADEDTPLWILSVSPTALKNFDGYVTSVAAKFNLPPMGVVTTVSFDPSKTYGSLRFADPRPNENVGVAFGRQEEAAKRLQQEPDVSAFELNPKKVATGKRR